MAAYAGLLHVPLGVGGLSIAARLLGTPALGAPTKAACLLVIAAAELLGAQWLLCSALARHAPLPPGWFVYDLGAGTLGGARGLLLPAALGTAAAVALAVASPHGAVEAQQGDGPAGLSALQELLTAGPPARLCTFLAFVGIAPLLEEPLYRGYLLPTLASRMPVGAAVAISAAAFAAAHPSSPQDFPQLFAVGIALGLAYAWTGNLAVPVLVHELYNGVALLKAGTDAIADHASSL
eukprot:SM000060S19612  [mRNA]  locus=s60:125526:126552:- [translate_table: standard]